MIISYSWIIMSVLFFFGIIANVTRLFFVEKDFSWSSIFVVALFIVLFVVSLILALK